MGRVVGYLPADFWENKVIQALKQQLPDDWVILPSVMWTLEKNGYVRDGEADIVVLAPELGLIVVEVKGSKEFKVNEEGKWLRMEGDDTWVQLKESPVEQATRNMHDLIGTINKNFGWNNFVGLYSFIVVYPQGRAVSVPDMFDESTLATYRHMNQLTSRLRHSLECRGGKQKKPQFSIKVVEDIIDQLRNRKFHVQKIDTTEDVTSDLNNIEQLTRQQFASLKGLGQLNSVAVIGPAGSGKSILAMWRLQTELEQGKRAIYVCYNTALADFLRLRNPKYASSIWNVDKFFVHICPQQRAGVGSTNFYRESLPGFVMDKADDLEKYDTIIVDEGQDFSEEQIIALLDLKVDEGQWAFFADWKQDLYGAGSGIPIGAEVIFHLHHNCRNTVKINDVSNRVVQTKIASMPGMPVGELPLVNLTTNQAMCAWDIAKQWKGKGSIAILSPFKLENSAMNTAINGHSMKLTTDINLLGTDGFVFFSTIKSFKGLEASCVIVVDISVPDEHVAFQNEDFYVACTRATARLALVSQKQTAVQYLKSMLEGLV